MHTLKMLGPAQYGVIKASLPLVQSARRDKGSRNEASASEFYDLPEVVKNHLLGDGPQPTEVEIYQGEYGKSHHVVIKLYPYKTPRGWDLDIYTLGEFLDGEIINEFVEITDSMIAKAKAKSKEGWEPPPSVVAPFISSLSWFVPIIFWFSKRRHARQREIIAKDLFYLGAGTPEGA